MRPKVTVALPTYQRVDKLQRAIESVLAQDYEPVELIISDNASSDGTRQLCEDYADRYPLIQYVCQPVNIGPTPNFEQLRARAQGEYFMFLGDDDWIDPGYISACVASIEANPGSSLVAGQTVKHLTDEGETDPYPINITDDDARQRVLTFCRTLRANGVFYGVMPSSVDHMAPRLRNVLGGDVVHVMALAYLGAVRTLDDVAVHRTVDGMTVNLANVATILGLGWFQANAPQIAIAYWIFRDIAFDSPLYTELGRFRRFRLGVRAGGIVFLRFVPPAVVKFGCLQLKSVSRRLRPWLQVASATG